jgi:putative transposase
VKRAFEYRFYPTEAQAAERCESKRGSRASAEYTSSAFRFRHGKLTLAKMADRALARTISDAAWFQFRSLLEYKARWYGREVIAVNRFFPSSRLCSDGGARQERMPLDVRTWACGCGTIRDRGVNAAKNLMAAGLAASVCRAGVRPQRSTPGGQSATKQKPLQREP